MLEKDYAKWHKLKSKINENSRKIYFREQEVWLCSIGSNVGFEQDGKGEKFVRPILIVKKYNLDTFWAVPLTSKERSQKLSKYYQKISFNNSGSYTILSQLRLFDKKRLVRKLATISDPEFNLVKSKLKALL